MDFNSRFGLTRDLNLPLNPFTDIFTTEEIEFYDLPGPYSKNGVHVDFITPQGQVDDYLNKNFRITSFRAPALWIDKKLWMSLTPMEIQSAYVPLTMAGGVVGTAGLGLGYFPLRAASNPNVEEVHVYELKPKVIAFFKEAFKGRPELEKIQFHVGDVREKAMYNDRKKGPSFDFFWMDVYQTMLPDTVINDIALFEESAAVQDYRFWGQEKVVLDSLYAREAPKISFLEKAFFKTWQTTPINQDPSSNEDLGVLSDLYDPITDAEYRRDVLVQLGILPEE